MLCDGMVCLIMLCDSQPKNLVSTQSRDLVMIMMLVVNRGNYCLVHLAIFKNALLNPHGPL